TAGPYLLERAPCRSDGRRVEINRLTRCEKLLERRLVHPYVALQACLEPPNGKAPCRLIHRYSDVGCHFAFSFACPVAFPALRRSMQTLIFLTASLLLDRAWRW